MNTDDTDRNSKSYSPQTALIKRRS